MLRISRVWNWIVFTSALIAIRLVWDLTGRNSDLIRDCKYELKRSRDLLGTM